MRQRITATVQKLKHDNIFWKIPIKILVNRHYYSLVTENVDSMCQTKTAGRGGGVYVLVVLRGEGVDDPGQTKQGEVCVMVFGGIEDPAHHTRTQYSYFRTCPPFDHRMMP